MKYLFQFKLNEDFIVKFSYSYGSLKAICRALNTIERYV